MMINCVVFVISKISSFIIKKITKSDITNEKLGIANKFFNKDGQDEKNTKKFKSIPSQRLEQEVSDL